MKPTVLTSLIHFVDENNDLYCGNNISDQDTVLTVPLGERAPDNVVKDEHLCCICWCVWLSIVAEHL
jgi:hypothetical protein